MLAVATSKYNGPLDAMAIEGITRALTGGRTMVMEAIDHDLWEIVVELGSEMERQLTKALTDRPGVLIVGERRFRVLARHLPETEEERECRNRR